MGESFIAGTKRSSGRGSSPIVGSIETICRHAGIVETKSDIEGAPNELSFYATEGYYRGPATRLRRLYTAI